MKRMWARMIAARPGRTPELAETLRDDASVRQRRRSRRRGSAVLAVSLALAAVLSRSGTAGNRGLAPAVGPTVGLQSIASGLGSITSITNARDSRLFLTTQSGQIRI